METRVEYASAEITIQFSDLNNTEVSIPLDVLGSVHNLDNYITDIEFTRKPSEDTEHPTGVICSDSLVIELKSNNKLFIPDNDKSPYYGYMDNTAILTARVIVGENELQFKKWYVNKWYTSISSSTPNKVIIIAYDIFSIIGKKEVPSGQVTSEMNIKDYLISRINAQNALNDANHQIEFSSTDINFDTFPVMRYENLDESSWSNCLNSISQATLTNIYIGRDNKLKTEYCGDDSAGESVCTISDMTSITSTKADTGGLANYNGVKVNASTGVINKTSKLAELANQTIVSGLNQFQNIKLGDTSVYKINYIIVKNSDKAGNYISECTYTKNRCSLKINSDIDTTCTIEIWGQTINNSQTYIERYKSGVTTKVPYEVTNTLIHMNYIPTYAEELVEIIGIKDNILEVVGYIDPEIDIFNTIYCDAEASTDVEPAYYKVMKVITKINSTCKTTLGLLKVFA